jgi:hypothetical protein
MQLNSQRAVKQLLRCQCQIRLRRDCDGIDGVARFIRFRSFQTLPSVKYPVENSFKEMTKNSQKPSRFFTTNDSADPKTANTRNALIWPAATLAIV